MKLILKHYCLKIIHIFYILIKLIKKCLRTFAFFLLNRQKQIVTQVSKFRVLLFFVFWFSSFAPVCINSWLFVYLLFLIYYVVYVLLSLYIMCIVRVRRGLNISCNNLCPILLLNLSQYNIITLHIVYFSI